MAFEIGNIKPLKQSVGNDSERMKKSAEWKFKAQTCPDHPEKVHTYIPIAWSLAEKSKHVKTLMCTTCFHEVNIAEAFEYRTKL